MEKTSSVAALRERRRQKILANSSERIGKILGTEAPEKEKTVGTSSSPLVDKWSERLGEKVEETVDNGVTIIRKKVTFNENEKDDEEKKTPRRGPAAAPSGFMVTHADGSTTHPKLSATTCRVLIIFLGVALSLLNAKYFLVTFFSWEIAVFFINGLPAEEPGSSLILLVALAGLKEKGMKKLKFLLKVGHCVVTDFSVLIVSSLLARVAFESYLEMKV